MKKYNKYRHLSTYIKENRGKGYSFKAIEKALLNHGYDPSFVRDLISSHKLENKLIKVVPLFLVLIALTSIILLIKPSIIGYITATKALNFADKVDLVINQSSEYVWDLGHKGVLNSVRVSGKVKMSGIARIYLEHENETYLIFDSEQLEKSSLEEITAFVVEDDKEKDKKEEDNNKDKKEKDKKKEQVNETINETQVPEINETPLIINKSVIIDLQYNKNTPYDDDDDGVELTTNIIDFTVAGSTFTWDYNESNLCTRWEIYSIENEESTIICYGSDKCCGFFGLVPLRESWKEPLYLAYNQYGSTLNNIISAQVLSIDYNLSLENPFFNIYFSDWKNLTAKFYEGFIKFEDKCIETCILPKLNATSYKLVFEVFNSSMILDSISYEILSEIINHAPVLLKNFSNISIFNEQSYALNLSEYFYDEDNDTLAFSFYNNSVIDVAIANETATLIPIYNFTGKEYMFFIANDSIDTTISNIFEIEVKKREGVLRSLRQMVGLK